MPLNVERIEKVVEEIITRNELAELTNPKGYIGFEPSGLLHLGTGLYWTNIINLFASQGVEMRILLADWHAKINDKLDGDMERIRNAAEYMRHGFLSLGLRDDVKFIYASDLVKDQEYWALLLKVAKSLTLPRLKRALPIMGRKEEDAESDASKLIYPLMQATDIFYMDLDIALGGMDQRHVHMMARDIHKKVGYKKFVAVHGPLITSLKGGNRMDPANKMSKSKSDSAIFINDTPEEIQRKINQAFCPEGVIEGNPVVDIYKIVIFNFYPDNPSTGSVIMRNINKEFNDFNEFAAKYLSKEITAKDLKKDLSERLIEILRPSREYFNKNKQLLSLVEGLK